MGAQRTRPHQALGRGPFSQSGERSDSGACGCTREACARERRDPKERTPSWVVGDAGRCRQVLLNLVGNGIRLARRSIALRATPFSIYLPRVNRDARQGADDEPRDLAERGVPSPCGIGIADRALEHVVARPQLAEPAATRSNQSRVVCSQVRRRSPSCCSRCTASVRSAASCLSPKRRLTRSAARA